MLQADAKNFELNRNANVQFCFQYLSQCILVLKNLGPSSLTEINSNYKGFYVPDFTQCSTPAQEPNIPISIRKTESYLFKLVVSASDQNPLGNAVKPLMPNGAMLGPVVENLLTPSLLYHIIEGRYVTLQTEEGWARVRLVWDKQYETHKIRKRKTIFAKS